MKLKDRRLNWALFHVALHVPLRLKKMGNGVSNFKFL